MGGSIQHRRIVQQSARRAFTEAHTLPLQPPLINKMKSAIEQRMVARYRRSGQGKNVRSEDWRRPSIGLRVGIGFWLFGRQRDQDQVIRIRHPPGISDGSTHRDGVLRNFA